MWVIAGDFAGVRSVLCMREGEWKVNLDRPLIADVYIFTFLKHIFLMYCIEKVFQKS